MFTSVIVPASAGLSMFLFGMKLMEWSLQSWAGRYLQTILERFTRTPVRGMLASTVITALMQSSTAVTIITIGLVNAGLIRFSHTLGIILGTNIGTTVTTELLGLNVQRLALPILLGSSIIWFLTLCIPETWISTAKMCPYRLLPLAVIGFACILLGMQVMQSIVPELQSRGLFGWFVQKANESLLWGLLAGAILTAVIHNGNVTIVMAMGLAAVQAISIEVGIAITLGANIGSCVTALFASIGGTRYGIYVACTHILLNLGGSALFYPFIGWLEQAVSWMTDSPASQIARSQTIFNIISSFIALPICYLPVLRKLDNRKPVA